MGEGIKPGVYPECPEGIPPDEDLMHIVKALGPTADDQRVSISQEIYYNTRLQERLKEYGWMKDALCLQVIGEEHMAWDMPGLTQADRRIRMDKLKTMLKRIWGSRAHNVNDIHKTKVAGMPRTLLFALMSNIDAHTHYGREHPELAEWLVQHALDTDDLETSFGMLVMRCRWKPTWEVAVRAQISIDHLYRMRRMPDATRGFALPGGGARKCTYMLRKEDKHYEWSSGIASGNTEVAQRQRRRHYERTSRIAKGHLRTILSARSVRKKNRM